MYAPPLITSLSAASLAKTPASQQAWLSLGGCIATPAHMLGVLLRPPCAAPATHCAHLMPSDKPGAGLPPDRWHSPSLCQAFHTEMQVASCSRICAGRTVLPASHWHHCFQRWFGWHVYIAQRELGMVRSRGRTQRPHGSLSKRQNEIDRKREREKEREDRWGSEREPQDRKGRPSYGDNLDSDRHR